MKRLVPSLETYDGILEKVADGVGRDVTRTSVKDIEPASKDDEYVAIGFNHVEGGMLSATGNQRVGVDPSLQEFRMKTGLMLEGIS